MINIRKSAVGSCAIQDTRSPLPDLTTLHH